MRLVHVTNKQSLQVILKDGLKLSPKRTCWRGVDGSILEERYAPASECPPAIYAYPLVEDSLARYNYWVTGDDSQERQSDPTTCGIIFEPDFAWLCIGTWAFGSDFATRKRPILWSAFKEQAALLAELAGAIRGVPNPNIYDVLAEYGLFTTDNLDALIRDSRLSAGLKALFKNLFTELDSVYRPGFEVCVMEQNVATDNILAWADLGGLSDADAWYDEGLSNVRIHRVR